MFDAYRVAVRLTLVNGVSAGLTGLMGQMGAFDRSVAGANGRLAETHAQMLKLQKLGMIGGVLAGIGIAGLTALKGPYEEAKKLAQAQADFKTLNLSAADSAMAFGKAASMSQQILGTNITDNVKSIHDLHTAFGDLHHAISTANDFAKFGFIAKVMNGGKDVDGLTYNAAKALEHRGQKVMGDDGEFRRELDMMERVYLGSRGKVNPSEFFHASQTGKLAYTLMDKEELYGPFAAYMQAKSGATAGTASMTFASSLIGGHMTNGAKGFLAELNLWDEGVSPKRAKMLSQISAGMTKEERKAMGLLLPVSGGLKEQYLDMAVHHQSQFVQAVMVPAIRKRFGLDMSDEAIATKLMAAFNRNTADFTGEYVVNAMKFKKDAEIFSNSMGIVQAYQHYLKTPEGAEIAAEQAWRNLKTVIGSIYIQPITNGLVSLAGSLTKVSAWIDAHPDLTKGLVAGFIGLSGVLAFSGTVLTLKAAFGGLALVLEFAGVGGPAGLATIASRLTGIGAGVGAIGSATGVATLGASLISIAGGLGVLYGATKGMAWFLENVIDPDTDPEKHPGMRRVRRRGKADTWEKDASLPQEHVGMHFQRAGRGGAWVPDSLVPAEHHGEEPQAGGGRYRPGLPKGSRSLVPPPAALTVQVVANTHLNGRILAQEVSMQQARVMSRPPTGPSGADTSMALAPVSHAGGY